MWLVRWRDVSHDMVSLMWSRDKFHVSFMDGGFAVDLGFIHGSEIVFYYPEFLNSQGQLKNHSNNFGMVIE